MSTLSFLAALPAAFAITGFVIYKMLGSQRESNRITTQIVKKLRANMPERSAQLANLPPRELSRELERDHQLRSNVGEKNFDLLQMVLRQEHTRSLVIYILCGVLFVVGVIAFLFVQTRPVPLVLDRWHLESAHPRAAGLAVDVDDLQLTWTATGPVEDISIALENLQTRRRTKAINVSSSAGTIIVKRELLAPILADRTFKSSNRVRAIARTRGGDSVSDELVVHVGLRVVAIPDPDRNDLLIAALIDNALVQGYSFEAKALAWRRKPPIEPQTWGGEIKEKIDVSIPSFHDFDWATLKIVYLGPDDLRLVRCEPERQ